LSRVRQVLDEDLPGMTDALLDAGCVWVDPIASLPRFITDRGPRPGDDRFRYVTGRRPVVEAVFARAADQHPNVTVRRGVAVGLGTGTSALTGVPHADAVRLATGEELVCDLVVDAMGRRTKLAEWLDELGARPPHVESEDSGFVYYTRYFKGPEQPAMIGPPVAPYGTISLLTLAGTTTLGRSPCGRRRRTPPFDDFEIRSASVRWFAPVPAMPTGSMVSRSPISN
jgi:2-polyprenyl-6-methoxyphenol hydroxylase-like FAD-dependent oxidoreductase